MIEFKKSWVCKWSFVSLKVTLKAFKELGDIVECVYLACFSFIKPLFFKSHLSFSVHISQPLLSQLPLGTTWCLSIKAGVF